jgi:hypothetical protein
MYIHDHDAENMSFQNNLKYVQRYPMPPSRRAIRPIEMTTQLMKKQARDDKTRLSIMEFVVICLTIVYIYKFFFQKNKSSVS